VLEEGVLGRQGSPKQVIMNNEPQAVFPTPKTSVLHKFHRNLGWGSPFED
jgi:hypothetical protein